MSRTLKVFLVIFVILLAIWIASEIAIPIVASSYIKNEIQKKYPEAGDVSVSIRAFPAVRLIFKQYSSLRVAAGNITLEGVTFNSIDLRSSSWPAASFEAVIGQDQVDRFFSTASSYLSNAQVSLEQDRIRVVGMVDIGRTSVNVNAVGTLEPVGGTQVFFRAESIEAGGLSLPPQTMAAVNEEIASTPIFTVREDLPFTISGVKVQQGKLTIAGDVDLEKALNFSL